MRTRYLRALIVIASLAGIAGVTLFVSSRLSSSQNVAPNAPESLPQAASKTTSKFIPDEDIRTTKPDKTVSSKPIVGRQDEKDYDPEDVPYTPKPTATPYIGAYITQQPTQKPSSPTSAPDNQAHYQTPQNTGSGQNSVTPSPTKALEPTPKPGEYGSAAPPEKRKDPNSYMSDTNNNCTDGLGFISGTGCFNGVRKVLNIPETQRAYQEHVNKVQDKIFSASDAELIDLAYSDNSGNKCAPGDTACNNCKEKTACLIKLGQDRLFQQNLIINLEDKERIGAEIALRDVVRLSTSDLEKKYGKTDKAAILAENKVSNSAGIVTASALLSIYKESKSPVSAMIEVICGKNIDCKNDLKGQTIDSILRQGIGDKLNPSFVNEVINSKKTQADSTYYQNLYLDQNLSDGEKVKRYCEKAGISDVSCRNTVNIDMLASYSSDPNALISAKKDYSIKKVISDPNNDINDLAKIYCSGKTAGCTPEKILSQIKDEGIRQEANDQLLFKLYTDIGNSTSDLAKMYCASDEQRCFENFQPDTFLYKIKDPNIKQFAQTNRNTALSNLIPLVVQGKPVEGIDNETKREVIKLNEQTTQAYWVFLKENRAKQLQGVTSEQLALEFDKLLKENPALLSQKLALYNQNPSLYNLPTAIKFDKEENPLIIAQYNQIIKTQPIEGLFDGTKIVSWSQSTEEIKQQARIEACEKIEAIKASCFRADFGSGKEGSVGYKNAVAEIDKYLSQNRYQEIFQQIYDEKVTNTQLTVNQSNLATIDNPTNDPILKAEIVKAKKAADVADIQNQMTYSTMTYGDGMGMAPIIVPVTYKGNNTKLTETEKVDLANEYIRRQVLVETYTRGAGVTGALTTAGIATAACSAFGPPGIAISIGCGAVAGLAGVISNIVPILGTATAEEIEAERQFWVKKTGNEQAGTFIQAMYTNQGAASDESWFGGRSQSNLNNQYALLQKIQEINYQSGATTNSLSDPNYQAELALQPFLLGQGELIQEENKQQQIFNIASSVVVGGISGGVGGSLANKAATQLPNSLASVFKGSVDDMILWAGGAAINDVQTQYQFDQTVSYIDTQSEIDLEKCNRTYGSGSETCKDELELVIAENDAAKDTARQQAIITDAIIQTGQTVTSFSTSLYGYFRPSTNSNTPNPQANINQTIDPNGTVYISNSNIPTEILNLITPPSNSPNNNSQNQQVGILNNSTNDAINLVASGDNFLKSQEEIKTLLDQNPNLDKIDKDITLAAFENKTAFKDYILNPNEQTLQYLLYEINGTAEQLASQFGGDLQTAKTGYLEALLKLNERADTAGRSPGVVDALLAPVKTELGIAKNNTPVIASNDEYTPTLIDPLTEATERLINLRSKRDKDLSLEDVKILIEGIEVTDEMAPKIATTIHELQQTPEFKDAVKQITGALAQAESAKRAITNSGANTAFFDEASNRIIFDKTAELAKKLSPSNTAQQTAVAPQPNTPPPATAPQPNTPPPATIEKTTLTADQKTQLTKRYIAEKNKLNQSGLSNTDYRQQLDELNQQYQDNYGLRIVNDLPEGVTPLRSALISLQNLFFNPGTPESEYNRFFANDKQGNEVSDITITAPTAEQIRLLVELQTENPTRPITIEDVQSRLPNLADRESAAITQFIDSIEFNTTTERLRLLISEQNRAIETAKKTQTQESANAVERIVLEERRKTIAEATEAIVKTSPLPDSPTPPKKNYNTSNLQSPDITENTPENAKGTIERGSASKYWGIDTYNNRSGKVYTDSEALNRVTILEENLAALDFLKEETISLSSGDQKVFGKESTTNREILVNELILTKEHTIAKRLGIPLENIHYLSNEDLALVMTSFHRLVDGQLELVGVDQNGNVTYRHKTTKETFVLGPEWPDTRLINKMFADQKYSAIAGQDVTKLYYEYLLDNRYVVPTITDKIITPVSATKQLNYSNEKYFDINTGKYTNTESPYTRSVIDDQGNVGYDIFFESPINLRNERAKFISELESTIKSSASKKRTVNAAYSKNDLIELINQRVITLDEANSYATAVNKPQITATDLAPQDIFPSTMPEAPETEVEQTQEQSQNLVARLQEMISKFEERIKNIPADSEIANTQANNTSTTQKTFSPEERADLLRVIGVKQTEAELMTSPTPHSVQAIKDYFLNPVNDVDRITQTELTKALIESDMIQVVVHDRDLLFELDKQILEKTGFTYSELKSRMYRDSEVFNIYEKLQKPTGQEKTGLTPRDIFSKYELQEIVAQADPNFVFEEIFGTYDYEIFKQKFPNDDFDREWLKAGFYFAQKELKSEYALSDGYISEVPVYLTLTELLNTPDDVIFKTYPHILPDEVYVDIAKSQTIADKTTNNPQDSPTQVPPNKIKRLAISFGNQLKQIIAGMDGNTYQTIKKSDLIRFLSDVTNRTLDNIYLTNAYIDETTYQIIKKTDPIRLLDNEVDRIVDNMYLPEAYIKSYSNDISIKVKGFISSLSGSKKTSQQSQIGTATPIETIATSIETGNENLGLKQIRMQRLVENYEYLLEKSARLSYIKELKAKVSRALGKDVDTYSSSFTNPEFNKKTIPSPYPESKYLPWIPRFAGLIYTLATSVAASMELDLLPEPLKEFLYSPSDNIDLSTGGNITKNVTPTPTPSSVITPTSTPTSKPTIPIENLSLAKDPLGEGLSSDPNKTIVQITTALNSCQYNADKNDPKYSQKIQECFCNSYSETCSNNDELKQISETIAEIFNQNINQKSIMELYFLLHSGSPNSATIRSGTDPEVAIIINAADASKALYSQCKKSDLENGDSGLMSVKGITSNGPLIGDIIVTEKQNEQYVCLETEHLTDPITLRTYTTCKTISKNEEGKLALMDIEILPNYTVFRSNGWKESSCWKE